MNYAQNINYLVKVLFIARNISCEPYTEAAVDLIGPQMIRVGKREVIFSALTVIDPVTNLTELVRIEDKTAEHIARKFAYTWLSRYSWPQRCIHGNRGEFTGFEFQKLLEQCSIKDVPTTSRNPMSNAICEQMH